MAKIIPIYKNSGSKDDVKNYRPISLLNIISKIFEACIYDRLYSFLDSKFFFKHNQFGFLRQSNTTSACISFVDKIQRGLNENRFVCTIFLDVAKAFDCVVRSVALELFDKYIYNRFQSVSISEKKETKYGVAQGSKLGPLLFIIYMNDIFELKLNGKLQLYADDSSLTYIANDPESLLKMITEDLDKISHWFKNNILVLNAKKNNNTLL